MLNVSTCCYMDLEFSLFIFFPWCLNICKNLIQLSTLFFCGLGRFHIANSRYPSKNILFYAPSSLTKENAIINDLIKVGLYCIFPDGTPLSVFVLFILKSYFMSSILLVLGWISCCFHCLNSFPATCWQVYNTKLMFTQRCSIGLRFGDFWGSV